MVPTITANAGDIVNIDINAEEYLSLAGMQMTLEIDNSLVELVDIQSQSLNFGAEHMGFGRLSDGLINISWNDNVSNTVKDKILTIKVKVLKSVADKSVLTLQKSQLAPELYLTEGADIQTASVQLSTISREKPDSDIFEVYQNVPNPFNASTVIGFNLPASNVATVKLFDLTGKLVYQNSQNFQKGYNTFTIDAQSLNLNGVLYYQIDTDTDSATRKMIIIK